MFDINYDENVNNDLQEFFLPILFQSCYNKIVSKSIKNDCYKEVSLWEC